MNVRISLSLLAVWGVLCASLHSQAQPVYLESPAAEAAVQASGFAGAVVVRELGEERWQTGNATLAEQRFIPASTFKVFSSLVALETGVVADASTVIAWDGITRERTEINADLDLQSAFRLSAVPHYQELVRRVGEQRMQHFIDAVGYGNRDTGGGIDTFWLTGGLRISPREQVEFLARLYRDDLPFSPSVMATVKAMMLSEEAPDYRIRSKTGLAVLDGDENTGWWVGWVEQGSQVHVFAAVLQARSPAPDFIPARQSVVRQTLAADGIAIPSP